MNVKATTAYDLNVYKAINDAVLFKGKNPIVCKALSLAIIGMTLLSYGAVIILPDLISGTKIDAITLFPVLMLVLITVLFGIAYFVAPRAGFKKLTAVQGIVSNSFEFDEDSVKVESSSEKLSSTSNYKYTALVKVLETSEYIFLFINPSSAFVVAKSGIEKGKIDEVCNTIKAALGKKYKIAKY